MPEKITVLLADDHSLVRRGFRRMLDDDPAMVVVGEAANGAEAVALAAQLSPQVIVMDCAMPRHDRPRRDAPDSRRVAACRDPDAQQHSEQTLVRQALAARARGYILKSAVDSISPRRSSGSPPARRCSNPALDQSHRPHGGGAPTASPRSPKSCN